MEYTLKSPSSNRYSMANMALEWASQVMLVIKNPLTNAGDTGDAGSIPQSGGFPGEVNGNTLQYSCLENPMDREAWQLWSLGHKE